MQKINDLAVKSVFNSYPANMRKKLMRLRHLIVDVAEELDADSSLEESLKWGEPGYWVKGGSTIRLGWKKSKPDQYAVYFHCKTKLVDVFKELYSDDFYYEGNRAIIFQEHDTVPVDKLKHCISLSLKYHKIKHLPMLGA